MARRNSAFSFILRPLSSAVLALCLTAEALAVPLIRDAEIEHTLRLYTDPVLKAGGLKPSAVSLFLVEDDSLNSYVAGGANIFVHTGLIFDCPTPDMLIGVLAHEAGHIVGGHLARGSEKLKDAQLGSIFTFVLGAAAAVASGRPEAAAAVITGGQNVVGRNFLAFTRAHEDAADQSALKTLDSLGISAAGLLKVFETLRRHEREHTGSPDPYMLTHPLTRSRIEHVRDRVGRSKILSGRYPAHFDALHERMIAKLYGFLRSPEQTLSKYPLSNRTVAARMARAVAYYKMPDMDRALAEMDGLIRESPQDPFFHELKGQILFENNRPKEALTAYREAVRLLPGSPLLLADLGKVELAQQDAALLGSAVAHLEKSAALDHTNPGTWRLLATAYGKAGQRAMAALALAEEAILGNDPATAQAQVEQALPLLQAGTPARLRAQDIQARAGDLQREKDDAASPF